eukprot:COSAG02_NODE_34224_length_487_cov_1.314433_1_plen_21_part_10
MHERTGVQHANPGHFCTVILY